MSAKNMIQNKYVKWWRIEQIIPTFVTFWVPFPKCWYSQQILMYCTIELTEVDHPFGKKDTEIELKDI